MKKFRNEGLFKQGFSQQHSNFRNENSVIITEIEKLNKITKTIAGHKNCISFMKLAEQKFINWIRFLFSLVLEILFSSSQTTKKN